jgi:hypothetical protein
MIRKVLLDDDILLDILLEREPFVEDSSKIWELIDINNCFTECNSLSISRQSLIIALQHTKELTIKLTTQLANQDIDFSDLNYNILVNEISRYFDQFIIKLTSELS